MKKHWCLLAGIGLLIISCEQVNTSEELVQSLVLDKTTITIDISETEQITATSTSPVVWSSSDNTIATVVNGLVTPVMVGSVEIYAIMNDITKTCSVTITDRELKNAVTDYSKTYYALDGITKTGMLSVSGSTDSFTGEISNTVMYASIETVNGKTVMVTFAFMKSISGTTITYTISSATTQNSSYLYLSTVTPVKIKYEDDSIYEPDYITRSNTSSSGVYTSLCLYSSDRSTLNKLRSEESDHIVRVTTTTYGSIDITVPADFFIYLAQI